jgi:hypothetical protein
LGEFVRRLGVPIAACLLALTIAACSESRGASTIDVELEEWAIDVSADRYLAGPVQLQIHNSGEFPHTLVAEAPDGAVLAATEVIDPGESTTVDLNLTDADYRFTCRIVTSLEDGTVVDHFAEGMIQTIKAATSD